MNASLKMYFYCKIKIKFILLEVFLSLIYQGKKKIKSKVQM